MPDQRERQFVVKLEAGADSLPDLAGRLRDVANRIELDGIRQSVGGSPSGWQTFHVEEKADG